jgi:hypothetical protein
MGACRGLYNNSVQVALLYYSYSFTSTKYVQYYRKGASVRAFYVLLLHTVVVSCKSKSKIGSTLSALYSIPDSRVLLLIQLYVLYWVVLYEMAQYANYKNFCLMRHFRMSYTRRQY